MEGASKQLLCRIYDLEFLWSGLKAVYLIAPAGPASPCSGTGLWSEGCPGSSSRIPRLCWASRRGSAWADLGHTCGRCCADRAGWAGGWRAPYRRDRSAPARCSSSAPVEDKNSVYRLNTPLFGITTPSFSAVGQMILSRAWGSNVTSIVHFRLSIQSLKVRVRNCYEGEGPHL